jgi:hypothetical protein
MNGISDQDRKGSELNDTCEVTEGSIPRIGALKEEALTLSHNTGSRANKGLEGYRIG